MNRNSKRGNKGNGGARRRGGSGSEPPGGRDAELDDPAAALDAAFAKTTRDFQQQDKEDELKDAQRERLAREISGKELEKWKRDAPKRAAQIKKAHAAVRDGRSRLLTEEEVAELLRLLHERDRFTKGGRFQADRFGETHSKGQVQNVKELHCARRAFGGGDDARGERLLRHVLITVGYPKMRELAYVPKMSPARIQEYLDRGIDVLGDGQRRQIWDCTSSEVKAFCSGLKEGNRSAHARNRLRWPESLIGHAQKLLADWPDIKRAMKTERGDVSSVLDDNLKELLRVRAAFHGILLSIESYFDQNGYPGWPRDLLAPERLLYKAYLRIFDKVPVPLGDSASRATQRKLRSTLLKLRELVKAVTLSKADR